ncbi:hypothetical protein NEOKW01_0173 [Nematocida sp. AWRm80]|nr:hypothetical protein NEOKW01_0173 [Nematocida sp. AWRm80]
MRLLMIVLGIALFSCKEIQDRYKNRLSLYQPYTDINGNCTFGTMLGDGYIVSKGNNPGVYLAHEKGNSFGAIKANRPIGLKNWKIDMHMAIDLESDGIGIWLGDEFQLGDMMGGSSKVSRGIGIFLSLKKNSYNLVPKSISVVSFSYGQRKILLSKKIPYLNENMLFRLIYIDNELKIEYSNEDIDPIVLGPVKGAIISPQYTLAISGSSTSGDGTISIRTISIFEQFVNTTKKYITDDKPRVRSPIIGAGIFLILICGIIYYLHKQQPVTKHKKGLV